MTSRHTEIKHVRITLGPDGRLAQCDVMDQTCNRHYFHWNAVMSQAAMFGHGRIALRGPATCVNPVTFITSDSPPFEHEGWRWRRGRSSLC